MYIGGDYFLYSFKCTSSRVFIFYILFSGGVRGEDIFNVVHVRFFPLRKNVLTSPLFPSVHACINICIILLQEQRKIKELKSNPNLRKFLYFYLSLIMNSKSLGMKGTFCELPFFLLILVFDCPNKDD